MATIQVRIDDDLKSKAKKAMNEIIKKCSNLTALEPLLHVASKEILKNVLGQFVTYLKKKSKQKLWIDFKKEKKYSRRGEFLSPVLSEKSSKKCEKRFDIRV